MNFYGSSAEAEALAHTPPTIAVEGAAIDRYASHDRELANWVFTHFD
ncbi:hypothetical protein ACW910_28110 (plasmid) [Burkholderia ambifaria]